MGQMSGQGQLKVQDMNLRDPGEKGENFKAAIFATKKNIVSMQNFTGSSMVLLFSSFCTAYFCQKTNLKILHMDVFKAFGRYESHFQND